MQISCGIAIIENFSRILLIHPTGWGWKNNLGIPKGHLEEGEELLECALRETWEETGLEVPVSTICNPKRPFSVQYKKKGKVWKKCYVFVSFLPDKSMLGMRTGKVPVGDIPMPEEVDHAEFFTKEEAQGLISPKFRPFLKFLK